MPDTVKTGTILIKEGTLLPKPLPFESEPCAPGWRLIKNLDGYELGRKIHEADWTFFGLTGEIGATAFGFDEQKTLRRAVEQILANLESAKFNSLEIMRVTSEASKRFLGVRYVTVSAQSRHIQESQFLLEAKDRQEFVPGRIDSRAKPSMGLETGDKHRQEQIIKERNVAAILNS